MRRWLNLVCFLPPFHFVFLHLVAEEYQWSSYLYPASLSPVASFCVRFLNRCLQTRNPSTFGSGPSHSIDESWNYSQFSACTTTSTDAGYTHFQGSNKSLPRPH